MGSLIVIEILFSVVWLIGLVILIEFIRARDGELRKIMIADFAIEVFMFLGGGVYYYLVYMGLMRPHVMTVLAGIVSPKALSKLWLLKWVRKSKKQTLVYMKFWYIQNKDSQFLSEIDGNGNPVWSEEYDDAVWSYSNYAVTCFIKNNNLDPDATEAVESSDDGGNNPPNKPPF